MQVYSRFTDLDYDERLSPSERDMMTLTYALIADGGIILAADSQVTHKHKDGSNVIATYEKTRSKIKQLENGGAFSIAGNSAFADVLLEKAKLAMVDKKGDSFEDVTLAHSLLFRKENKHLYGHIDLPYRPGADFLFCGYMGDTAHIVKLSSDTEFSYVTSAVGNGYGFSGAREHGAVLYLHHRFYRNDMPLEQAKLLAYYIVAEVADLDNSVGGPIEMMVITKVGVEPFANIESYEQKRQQLTKQVRALLLRRD